ncbi:MAG: phosphotransferase [Desulfobacterales bacterium]|nr:MAG: phosphotransferase [Desulfobacterales bacterium]
MKAMILAAGLGTRLLPYTATTPKPLFSVAGRPLLDIILQRLQAAGCEAVVINTHHLPHKIEAFVAGQQYGLAVSTRYEPTILGTGGAIKNVADFWNDRPFMVINGDICTNIDLKAVYDYHCAHPDPATLVLHDYPEFNFVSVDQDGFITGFYDPPAAAGTRLAFTGIQVLDPEVLERIPSGVFSSSIDAYRSLMAQGRGLRAFVPEGAYWKDIGTPARYQEAVREIMAPEAFRRAFTPAPDSPIQRTALQGDGSERKWYRLTSRNRSLIMVDHGIRQCNETSEVDAFVHIGHHLHRRGIPVPAIYHYDTFAGLVFLEDLGDHHLQSAVLEATSAPKITAWYKSVIDHLVRLSQRGAQGFRLAWTFQTPRYSQDLILEKECRYFVEAFLNGYLGLEAVYRDFQQEFEDLAHKALAYGTTGFMHRDMQSRNIMLKNDDLYFIDFQGGRLGPLQYDLASLLIDPYVNLPAALQTTLREYCIETLLGVKSFDPEKFRRGFRYCALTRNLQILGAFGYLSTIKGKTYFQQYIPAAVRTLKENLAANGTPEFPRLAALIAPIVGQFHGQTGGVPTA